MDRGAWWATVQEVESQTQLNNETSTKKYSHQIRCLKVNSM